MTRVIFATLVLAFASACPADDEKQQAPEDAGGDTSGTVIPDTGDGADGASSADGAAADAQGTDASGTDAALPTGACLEPADQALLDTQAERDAVAKHASDCGIDSCLVKPKAEREGCLLQCMQTSTGLGADCAACYAGISLCAIYTSCISDCVPDPERPDCLKCMLDNGCYDAFYACSGLPARFQACLNPADEPKLDSVAERAAATAAAVECGTACLDDVDVAVCATTCMSGKTDLTSDCTDCYVQLIACGATHCDAVCATDLSALVCQRCLNRYCYPTFFLCTGLPPPAP